MARKGMPAPPLAQPLSLQSAPNSNSLSAALMIEYDGATKERKSEDNIAGDGREERYFIGATFLDDDDGDVECGLI